MKYYSEVFNKNFDTIEDLESAEKTEKEKSSPRQKRMPPVKQKLTPLRKFAMPQKPIMRKHLKCVAKLCLAGAQQRGNLLPWSIEIGLRQVMLRHMIISKSLQNRGV